jgi:hypothetical protein
MTWKQTALRYLDVIDKACKQAAMASRQEILTGSAWKSAVPELRLGHFLAMCDSAGILQHAVHTVPDRAHGYCVDDNARALILACVLDGPDEESLPEELSTRFAAFVQHAWNPDTRRFRNFMGYGRNWLEPRGSEDSHGRTLWALGECARSDRHPARQRWARGLFLSALPPVETFSSPRARAFALLGLDGYCEVADQDSNAAVVRIRLARKLSAELDAVTTPDWVWFEDELAYDNARLPQALIVTGMATDTPGLTQAGLRALTWLMALQKAPSGCFRPVGTEGFGVSRRLPQAFDQQPVEAAATIAACIAAWRATDDGTWASDAARAFRWFLGDNDLGVALADPGTGGCCDGLHFDRRNENNGAESILSYLLGLADIRELIRASALTDAAVCRLALTA